MNLAQLGLDLAPANLRAEVRRLYAKYSRKLRRVDRRVVRLPAQGEQRGSVLFSYIVDPFLLTGPARIPYSHTHFWESFTIARTWAELGFEVDCVSWTNGDFVPARQYDVVIDVRTNLERWAPLLPAALKVLHADTAHWSFHNRARAVRLEDLQRRRGVALADRDPLPATRAAETADAIVVLGNRFTRSTYAFAERPVLHVPVSVPFEYPAAAGKDFEAVRRRYLWFGSGGLVHKGLDLTLEAFAGLPDHQLTICGPVRRERDFERAYFRELYRTPNIRLLGWVDVAPSSFLALADSCLGLVYPSCSEGGGSSVYTCMHAGLLPLANFEVSVDIGRSFGMLLPRVDPETIRGAVRELSARPAHELAAMADAAREQARRTSSKEIFAAAYRRAALSLIDGSFRQAPLPPPLDPRELSADLGRSST
jgi:glycosyltransferase involved in cell wall biosynthesis